MAAPDITAVDAFLRPETSSYVLLDRTVTPGSPLRAEIDAGLALEVILTGIDGLQDSVNFVDVATFASLRTGTVPGRSPAISGSFMTLGDKDGADIRAEVARLELKTLIVFDGGDVPGIFCDVWDIQIGAHGTDHPNDSYMSVTTAFGVKALFPRVVVPA
jgi:hypothetical protein